MKVLMLLLAAVFAQAQTQQAARPQRTEAEARARAEANRKARTEQLISDYVAANVGPLPADLAVDPFYKKYVDAQGIPVIASDKVPDAALLVARDIVNSMLAARPDIRKALIARKWRTGVIAEVEMTMDIPEYSRMKRPGAPAGEPVVQEDRDYHANRSRGLGGNPTTGAEENLLGYPGTRYWGEHIWWFFSNYGECFAGNVKVETPEEFAAYDPALNALIARVYTSHRIPMDVFHAKKIRPVSCGG